MKETAFSIALLEQRKLQKLGYSTLLVSLPVSWVKQMNLKQGDTVNLTTDDQGRLIVHPSGELIQSRKRCVINADKIDEKLLGRLILGSYICGHEIIEVRTRSNEFTQPQLETIRKTVNELIGVGIVEQGVQKSTIQSFLDPSKFPIDGLISRLHLIVESMADLAVKALIEKRGDFAKQVLDMDLEADKVYFLATRQVLQAVEDKALAERVGLGNPRNIVGDRLVIKSLEEVGDYSQVIARSANKIIDSGYKGEADSQILELSQLAKEIGTVVMRSLYRHDVHSANLGITKYKELAEAEERVHSNLDQLEISAIATHLASVTQSIKQIGRYYTIIAETLINRSVEVSSPVAEVIQE